MPFIVALLAAREGPVRMHCCAAVRAFPLLLRVFCGTEVVPGSVNYQQGLCPVFGSIVKIKFLLKWRQPLWSIFGGWNHCSAKCARLGWTWYCSSAATGIGGLVWCVLVLYVKVLLNQTSRMCWLPREWVRLCCGLRFSWLDVVQDSVENQINWCLC